MIRSPCRAARLTAAIAVLAGLTGCAVGPDYHAPKFSGPSSFSAAEAGQMPPIDLTQWWRSLGDPQLDALVDQAIKANPDVEIALTRLQEARTQEIVLLGAALPQVEGAAAAANGSGSDLTRGRVPSVLTSGDSTSSMKEIHQLGGFDAAWDLDLFGQYRRAIEAGRYDTQAAADARNVVLVNVIADVVRAYVDLRGLQITLEVQRQNVAVAEKSRDFVKLRFEHGLTNALDLTLAERELATLQSRVAPLVAQIEAAQDAIAVLLGRYPEDMAAELAKPAPIPALPARIEPGLPLDLIRRRPDIREEERQLAAATARIGVATANLFPHIALSGSVGAQFPAFGVESASSIWSLGPSAYWPLLDFGSLDALVDIAGLKAQAQLLTYKKTVLGAVRDVDTAITAFSAQQDRVRKLADAAAEGQRAVALASERYDRGLTDYLNVVDAERQLYALDAELVSAQQTAAESFVAVFRSLGGGWEHYQAIPPIRQPQPAVLAMFDHLANQPLDEER
ncbi:MAG TPA: efflux transporter outer membrane subunit [Patescibacteria group bacterium]|nr:efflux transporter outer membrane subunit [Patescibacteria group bacterium]